MTINPDHFRPIYETAETKAIPAKFETFANLVTSSIMEGADYDAVSATFREFATDLDATVPESADKAAAIRCLRIAHAASMEIVTYAKMPMRSRPNDIMKATIDLMSGELAKASIQMIAAVAYGGK